LPEQQIISQAFENCHYNTFDRRFEHYEYLHASCDKLRKEIITPPMLHELLNKCGIYYAKRRYMPRGIDWLCDLQRLHVGGHAPMVFDIGANKGQTTSKVLQYFPNARVHAFEPVLETFNDFRQKFGTKVGVNSNQLAVSDSCGSASILVSSNSELSHLVMEPDQSREKRTNVEIVETTSIDAYCAKKGIKHIDILKTDTEGHDLPVLKGAERALRSGQVDWILTEVTFDPLDDSHSKFDAIQTFLKDRGFAVYCFYDHFFTHEDLLHHYCNALFVRKALSIGVV